ncbi:hypothetical protein [uncultured Zobellia sp.]|uniref:hypothetical protein n=1 Tax=uncultured Zobellia sp. TaxID=255433 RepID=UPI00259601A2|nr:hypothetical protein [uncultured Zobellia sp.]
MEVATAGGAAALTAAKVADKTIDAARVLDKLHDLGDAAKAADKLEDISDGTKLLPPPKELGDVVHSKGKTPKDLGVPMIADNPQLLKIWNDLLKKKANSKFDNEFKRYLKKLENGDVMDSEYLSKVYGQLRTEFGKDAKKLGYDFTDKEIHHWNFPKEKYPEQITNPKNLTEPIDRDFHEQIHDELHDPNSLGRNKWDKEIKAENEIKINSSPL